MGGEEERASDGEVESRWGQDGVGVRKNSEEALALKLTREASPTSHGLWKKKNNFKKRKRKTNWMHIARIRVLSSFVTDKCIG